MDIKNSNFNYNIMLAAMAAITVGILIAFYYSYVQSEGRINFLEQEKRLLVKDNALMKSDIDRLSALNEVNEIELQDSKHKIQQLQDSVGRLNFKVEKLKEYRVELRKLDAKNDSLKVKNNSLKNSNIILGDKYEETKKIIEDLKGKSSSLAETEALLRKKNKELSQELKTKSYLRLESPEGSGFRYKSGKHIMTNKANIISKLRGCVFVTGNPYSKNEERVIYFQFLGPNMDVIEDNTNTIFVNGNVYSKRVELTLKGQQFSVCDAINVPEGSLEEGIYTLNVFENEKLLVSSKFQLK